jgi:hypothetical protein
MVMLSIGWWGSRNELKCKGNFESAYIGTTITKTATTTTSDLDNRSTEICGHCA